MDEKQETIGNAAKLRRALIQCELFLLDVEKHGHPTLNPGDKCVACKGVEKLRAEVCAALAAPPRQCDMGTVEEQSRRMHAFCESHGHGFDGQCYSCENCRFLPIYRCELAWAQMPFEEGGAK